MDMDNTHNHYDNLWMSIGYSASSILSLALAHITTYSIAWGVGVVSGLVAIYAGILAIRERRLNIQLLKQKIKDEQCRKK
jgi:hypothetical protein